MSQGADPLSHFRSPAAALGRSPFPAPPPYALLLPLGAPSGAAASALAAQHPLLRGSAAGVAALHLVAASLAPSSRASYDGKWRVFKAFCDQASPCLSALPAAQSTVLAFIGHLARCGTVAATNVRPYLTAIGERHLDLGLANPTLGRPVSQAIAGWKRLQRQTVVVAPRTWVPADAILAVLHVGLSTLDPNILRACACSVVSFVCGVRALTAANVMFEDVVLGPTALSVLLRHEKRGQTVERRQLHLPLPWLSAVGALWQRWAACRAILFAAAGPVLASRVASSSAWASPSSGLTATSASVNELFRLAMGAVSYLVPDGFTWSFHSLRKGFATSAASIGIPDANIGAQGGWAVSSAVMSSKYIVRNVNPSVAAHLFFGWLRRDRPSVAPLPACWLSEASAAFSLSTGASAFREVTLRPFEPEAPRAVASPVTAVSRTAAAFTAAFAAAAVSAPVSAVAPQAGSAVGLTASHTAPACPVAAAAAAPLGRPPERTRRLSVRPARFGPSP